MSYLCCSRRPTLDEEVGDFSERAVAGEETAKQQTGLQD